MPADEPAAAVTVELLRGEEGTQVAGTVLTGEDGRFSLRGPTSDTYRLRASRIGFQTVVTPPFDLLADAPAFEVQVFIATEVVPLSPLVVVSDRPTRLAALRLHTQGFYERRSAWGKEGTGFGHFLEPEDVERRGAHYLRDLLRQVPGVRFESLGGRRTEIRLRATTSMRDPRPGCVPIIFIDGSPIADGTNVEEMVAAVDVMAVEVYPGLNQPARFQRGTMCGTIAIWTGSRLPRP